MAIINIVEYPDPILREECIEITNINQNIRKLVQDMSDTMYDAPGVGLAAPQIGENIRLIVLDPNAGLEDEPSQFISLINPEIIGAEGKVESEEGCLSIPGIKETIKRHEKITVSALDLEGKKVTIQADGFLAIVLQHEIDHINGILFIDYLSRLKQKVVKAKLKKNAN